MMTKQSLLIFPANGNGLEALDCLGETYTVRGFVDDDPEKIGTQFAGYPYGIAQPSANFQTTRFWPFLAVQRLF